VSALSTVVAREYLTRVRSKPFVVGTLAAPILFLGFLTLSAWIGTRTAESEVRIGVVDRTGVLAPGLLPRLEDMGFRATLLHPEGAGPAPLERGHPLLAQVTEGGLQGIVEVDQETLRSGRIRWWGVEGPSPFRRLTLQQAVGQAVLQQRFQDEGDAGTVSLLGGGSLDVVFIGEESDPLERVAGMALGLVGAFVLYFALLVYGAMVLRSVLEEKTGRIVEVILSSVRPWELMLGKILGVGAVGLTQLLIWSVFAAGLLGLGAAALLPTLRGSGVVEEVLLARMPEFLPGPGVVVFFLLCFFLGYFIYASVFAAVGAMCSTEEEAQQLQLPVVMVVLVPFLFLLPVLEDPGSSLAVTLSLIPLFSPILMFARLSIEPVPAWQLGASVVGMGVTLALVAWAAGRIYRTGILMQGKRPTLPELWRWIREG
jgi:ABC-2 type transport system permease protein